MTGENQVGTARSRFWEAHAPELKTMLGRLRAQLLYDCIPFWESRLPDRAFGGFYSGFDRTGKLADDRKAGWFVGRTMYTFAALYNDLEPRGGWLEIAESGRRYLDACRDENDRFYYMLDRKGNVISGVTSLFTDHFAVKGLYEYLRAAEAAPGHPDLLWAKALTDKLFANVKEPAVLAGECPSHLQKHAVTFMTLLVAQESRHLFGDAYRPVLDECLQRALYVFANDAYGAPLEYVGLDGQPCLEGCGRLVDPGHTLESMWFSMSEGQFRNDPQILKRAETVIDWVIDRCYDEQYGGFVQHCDIDLPQPEAQFLSNDYAGHPAAWDDKIWWVQAEALLALGMSTLLNENERHYRYFQNMFNYVETFFRDREYGEWYSIAKRDGTVSFDHKGFALKGAYHVPRCLLKLIRLLEAYLSDKPA